MIKEKKIHVGVSHGFMKKRGIITNSSEHVKKRYVVNLDIKDYFDSFHFGRVRGFFEKNRHFDLPIEVATVIAQLVCYNKSLPQGAPTSPIITNLMCNILDMRLLKIAGKFKLYYTRYADDLTFSTNDKHFLEKWEQFIQLVSGEIERYGLLVNESKTRLIFNNSRQ